MQPTNGARCLFLVRPFVYFCTSWAFVGCLCDKYHNLMHWLNFCLVECPAMVDPASGTVSVSSNGSHSLAVFSCVSGYHILGATELNCGDSGTWSDNPPACSKCQLVEKQLSLMIGKITIKGEKKNWLSDCDIFACFQKIVLFKMFYYW